MRRRRCGSAGTGLHARMCHKLGLPLSGFSSASGASRGLRPNRSNGASSISFLSRVREQTRRMLADGRQLAGPMTLDAHLKRLVDDFAQLSAYRQKTGYFSWLDAVRQEFRSRQVEQIAD